MPQEQQVIIDMLTEYVNDCTKKNIQIAELNKQIARLYRKIDALENAMNPQDILRAYSDANISLEDR